MTDAPGRIASLRASYAARRQVLNRSVPAPERATRTVDDHAAGRWTPPTTGTAMPDELLNHAHETEAPAADALAELATALDALIAAHHDPRRNVLDYGAAGTSREFRRLRAAVDSLAGIDPATLSTQRQRVALWLNVYNTLVVHAVIARRIASSVRRSGDFFDGPHYCVGAREISLDVIEHGLLRRNARKYLAVAPVLARDDARLAWAPRQLDPRVHFALYTASGSSPALRAFRPDTVDEQLDAAARDYLDHEVRLGAERLLLPATFRWYAPDFGGDAASIAAFIRRHLPADERAVALGTSRGRRFGYADYDWTLNDRYGTAEV